MENIEHPHEKRSETPGIQYRVVRSLLYYSKNKRCSYFRYIWHLQLHLQYLLYEIYTSVLYRITFVPCGTVASRGNMRLALFRSLFNRARVCLAPWEAVLGWLWIIVAAYQIYHRNQQRKQLDADDRRNTAPRMTWDRWEAMGCHAFWKRSGLSPNFTCIGRTLATRERQQMPTPSVGHACIYL